MARITCFADSPILMQQLQQCFAGTTHNLQMVTASHLTHALRTQVQQFSPDLILMELSQSMDNPHIFFFLRSDQTTRNTPIVVFSNSPRSAEEAAILGADGYLPRVFVPAQLHSQVHALLPQEYAVYAA